MTGDDVSTMVANGPIAPSSRRTIDPGSVVSANAYLGAEPIVEALPGADVVIAGRVADPSLFVAPMLTPFGWAGDDWPRSGSQRLPATCSNAQDR